ncbi:MAG: transcription antitermination factor NusB [Propionibacteriaceae bacterium]|nr:transcription antitermination factor NusB [Propionibacteriaceae bacterium]
MSEPVTATPASSASAPPAPSPAAKTPHRSGRRKARKYALDLLFAADLRQTDAVAVLEEYEPVADPPISSYTRALVRGVAEERGEIDALLRGGLKNGWTLERMPRVDRNLARIALFEIRHGLPAEVAISEAAALAAELSTDDSPSFLHGLLGAIGRSSAEDSPEDAREAGPETGAGTGAETDTMVDSAPRAGITEPTAVAMTADDAIAPWETTAPADID